jgi:hypothetical protein
MRVLEDRINVVLCPCRYSQLAVSFIIAIGGAHILLALPLPCRGLFVPWMVHPYPGSFRCLELRAISDRLGSHLLCRKRVLGYSLTLRRPLLLLIRRDITEQLAGFCNDSYSLIIKVGRKCDSLFP